MNILPENKADTECLQFLIIKIKLRQELQVRLNQSQKIKMLQYFSKTLLANTRPSFALLFTTAT